MEELRFEPRCVSPGICALNHSAILVYQSAQDFVRNTCLSKGLFNPGKTNLLLCYVPLVVPELPMMASICPLLTLKLRFWMPSLQESLWYVQGTLNWASFSNQGTWEAMSTCGDTLEVSSESWMAPRVSAISVQLPTRDILLLRTGLKVPPPRSFREEDPTMLRMWRCHFQVWR